MADDEKIPPDVQAAGEAAGQQFDQAALTLAAIPTRSNRFILLPVSKEKPSWSLAVRLLESHRMAASVMWLRLSHYSFIFNRQFAVDLAVLLVNRLEISPDELAASKTRLKLAD